MKTIILLPLVLAFGLSSFNTPGPIENKLSNTIHASTEYCSIYGVASLTRNGQDVAVDPNALLYFCSENIFTLNTFSYSAQGTWIDNGKNIMISVGVPDPAMEWVDGTWEIVERSDWTIEMVRTENGDTWRVRLEGRQR